MTESIKSEKTKTKELISSPQTFTSSWVALGKKINTKGLVNIGLWLNATKNSSDIMRFRIKCQLSNEDESTVFYTQIQSISSDAVTIADEIYSTASSTVNAVIPLGISELVPYIQLEIMSDTPSATPATLDEAWISFQRERR